MSEVEHTSPGKPDDGAEKRAEELTEELKSIAGDAAAATGKSTDEMEHHFKNMMASDGSDVEIVPFCHDEDVPMDDINFEVNSDEIAATAVRKISEVRIERDRLNARYDEQIQHFKKQIEYLKIERNRQMAILMCREGHYRLPLQSFVDIQRKEDDKKKRIKYPFGTAGYYKYRDTIDIDGDFEANLSHDDIDGTFVVAGKPTISKRAIMASVKAGDEIPVWANFVPGEEYFDVRLARERAAITFDNATKTAAEIEKHHQSKKGE